MAKIHQLKIRNYRGIKEFEQTFDDNNLIILIGRGDSGKSTILKAISMVLSPAWNTSFTDTDFYNLDTSKPIEIEATLRDVPGKLLNDPKFGLYKRLLIDGKIDDEITSSGGANSNKEEDILTIKLVVDSTLQPKWYVVNEQDQEDKEISHKDREQFNMFMVDDYLDNHFSFNKLSPLYALLKKGKLKGDLIDKELTELIRKAYGEIKPYIKFDRFDEVIEMIKEQASKIGCSPIGMKNLLEYEGNLFTGSNIKLHDDLNRPLAMYGKGSKRLLSIAIQLALAEAGAIILIDEIEQGLEPDRIRTIINRLSKKEKGQFFITTHSRDAVVESKHNALYLMIKDSSSLKTFSPDLQGLLRAQPEAFFARRVILCEGATEYGIIRAFDQILQQKGKLGLSARSIAVVDAKGGNNFYQYARSLQELGFDVLIFCDDDNKAILESKKETEAKDIPMAICEDGNSIEQQVFKDVPWELLIKLINLAIENNPEQNILSQLNINSINSLQNITNEVDQKKIRELAGNKAKKNCWYKSVTNGQALGEMLLSHRSEIDHSTTLYTEIKNITKWINGK